jgi:hypothetical protein
MTVHIYPDELIVGRPTSKVRGGAISPELQCDWILDELDLLSTRETDPFEPLTEEEKNTLRDVVPTGGSVPSAPAGTGGFPTRPPRWTTSSSAAELTAATTSIPATPPRTTACSSSGGRGLVGRVEERLSGP